MALLLLDLSVSLMLDRGGRREKEPMVLKLERARRDAEEAKFHNPCVHLPPRSQQPQPAQYFRGQLLKPPRYDDVVSPPPLYDDCQK